MNENIAPKQRRMKASSSEDGGIVLNDVAAGSEESEQRVDFDRGHIRGSMHCHNISPIEIIPEAPIRMESQVTCSIEAAARLYAEGYRAETHLAGLMSFCNSTGLPSFGTIEQMQGTLRAYGYNVRESV